MPDELREEIPSMDRSETTLEEGSQVVFDPRVFLTSTPSFVKKRKELGAVRKSGYHVPHSRGSPQYEEFDKPSKVYAMLPRHIKVERKISPIKVTNHKAKHIMRDSMRDTKNLM